VLWGIGLAVAGVVGQGLQGHPITGGLTSALSAAGVAYRVPLVVFPRHGWFSNVLAVVLAIAVASVVLTVLSVFLRRRGASLERRQQLAWLGYVGALTLTWAAALTVDGLLVPGNNWVATMIWGFMLITPVAGIPLACAVAVLRYRLYDLDVVVKKTVIGGLLAATFTAIYAIVVVGVGAAAGGAAHSTLTFAAAALAAVVFQPARSRAGLVADRLVYGRRASPYEVLSDFAGQIAGTYSTDDVLPSMARMVAAATGAERAEVWLHTAAGQRLEASWPPGDTDRAALAPSAASGPALTPASAPRPNPEPAPDASMPGPAGTGDRTRSFPVEHHGERLGALRVTSSPREPLTPADERLVRDVAAQAGLVLRNVGLIEDLRASRQRIVTAADEARRGLERNLHDGAQQQLVALKITLGLARQLAAGTSEEVAELLGGTEQLAEQALSDLRDLAHGIYPPLLSSFGLLAALEAQARKAAVPVTVEGTPSAGTPRTSRRPYTSASSKRCRTWRSTRTRLRFASLCATTAGSSRSRLPITAAASTRQPSGRAVASRGSRTGSPRSAAASRSRRRPAAAPA
jgi:signal transduction histidine kinase